MNIAELIKKYEAQDFAQIFMLERGGELHASSIEEKLRNDVNQIGVIVFETLAAIGQFPVDEIGILGSDRCVHLRVADRRLVISTFKPDVDYSVVQERVSQLTKELLSQPTAPVVEEKVEKEKAVAEVKLESGVLDRIKAECSGYLGDFADKIYQNQLKAQRVNPVEVKIDEVKRLIFGLNKAASMIIGPKRAKEMTDKLLEMVKGL
jgi:hypothetical protein